MDKSFLYELEKDGFMKGRTWVVSEIYNIMRDGPRKPDSLESPDPTHNEDDKDAYADMLAMIKGIIDWHLDGKTWIHSEGYGKICQALDEEYGYDDQDY